MQDTSERGKKQSKKQAKHARQIGNVEKAEHQQTNLQDPSEMEEHSKKQLNPQDPSEMEGPKNKLPKTHHSTET